MNRNLARRGEPTPLRDFMRTWPTPGAADLAGIRDMGASMLGRGNIEGAAAVAVVLDQHARLVWEGALMDADPGAVEAMDESVRLGHHAIELNQRVGDEDSN